MTEIHRKSLTFHIPPFAVTEGNWNWHRVIGHLWLPVSIP